MGSLTQKEDFKKDSFLDSTTYPSTQNATFIEKTISNKSPNKKIWLKISKAKNGRTNYLTSVFSLNVNIEFLTYNFKMEHDNLIWIKYIKF